MEGRMLGHEKGYELWEELAFYGAAAETWKDVLRLCDMQSRKAQKQLQHLESLLALLDQMPRQNNSSLAEKEDEDAPDLEKLLERIRARFKLTCTALGWDARGENNTSQPKKMAHIKGRTVDIHQLTY